MVQHSKQMHSHDGGPAHKHAAHHTLEEIATRGPAQKAKAVWIKCNGEAHSNPFIDNCGVCLPYWENIPTCPTDGAKLVETSQANWEAGTRVGYCRACKKHFDMSPHAAGCECAIHIDATVRAAERAVGWPS